MKNRLLIFGIIIFLIITNATAVFANTETTVTLQVDKTQVKVNENFTVTLKATCPDGINGIDTTYSYDTEKLELVSANVANSNFASLGAENQITVISNSTETIQSADIYTLTFKVKDGVAAGATATVSIAETILDSDAGTNSEHTIPAKEVTVTIIEDEEEKPEEKPEENPEEKPEENPEEKPEEKPEENPEEKPEENPEEKPEEIPEGEEPKVEDKKDQTVAEKEIPKAGINTMLVVVISAIVVVSVILYKKNKKYEGI